MTIDWPPGLPAVPAVEGYQETPPNTTIRTEMEAGVAKVRRRFTAASRPLRAVLILTRAQIAILDEFYVTELQSGALRFAWVHPRTREDAEFRFTKPPAYEPHDPQTWRAMLELEVMP